MKSRRSKLMSALFAEAAKHGIGEDQLRNETAPARLGKRLSKATEVEIEGLLTALFGTPPRRRRPQGSTTPHPSSHTEGRGEKKLMSGYTERHEDLGYRDGMATPAQLRKIEAMWMSVSKMPNHTAKEKALQGFLKRIVGVEDLRFVEDWMVQKIIKAIESMQRNPYRRS